MRIKLITFALAILLVSLANTRAQMLDPAIDRDDEPFCYFSQPTDVIGVMDGKEGTLITPEGYLCTGRWQSPDAGSAARQDLVERIPAGGSISI
ncbi:hypothetical protein HUU39_27850 [candidate division KSB1 bacterium]|nr:hypothetical protein [candidate division KSB1 bacterium]